MGSLWRENGLIFTSEVGELLEPSRLDHTPVQALARTGEATADPLPRSQAHMCLAPTLQERHPKIVSEMLGHATIAITLDPYSHVLPTMRESAAKAIEDAPSFRLLLPKPLTTESGTSLLPTLLCANLQEVYKYRRSGSNRHAPFGAPDFESRQLGPPRPRVSVNLAYL